MHIELYDACLVIARQTALNCEKASEHRADLCACWCRGGLHGKPHPLSLARQRANGLMEVIVNDGIPEHHC